MSEIMDLHSWLFDKTEKEKEIDEKIHSEIERFESSAEYLEHRQTLDELYEESRVARQERMEEGRKHRTERRKNPKPIPHLTPEEKEQRRKERYEALPEDLKKLIQDYGKLTKKEKLDFENFTKRPGRDEWGDLSEYENPITTHEDIRKLQDILVQDCIDFINEKGLTDIDAVRFSVDGLEVSAKFGEWTPTSDSSISVEGLQPENDGDKYPVRKIIGVSY